MQHIIATDEAGYGPNLGPLVIGATRWCSKSSECSFENALSDFVFDRKSKLAEFEKRNSTMGLMVADSKAVYSSGKIELLERGVLSYLFAIHQTIPDSVEELMSLLGVDSETIQDSQYFQGGSVCLPLKATHDAIETLGTELRSTLQKHDIKLQQLSVATVFPKRFNQYIEQLGNKASCLTAESLQLIASMMRGTNAKHSDHFDIRCDKHGGRNRYAPSIGEMIDPRVTVEQESRACSRYSFGDGNSTIQFSAKGESWLPIALASMCAKYVREVYMIRWNQFWQIHLPDLKPTKGYPVDARRFKKDIEKVQHQIGIADEDIWRYR